jgi:hypothetical protein
MTGPKPDPRTDGVGDGGEVELDPLLDDEIDRGIDDEEARRDEASP